MNSNDSVFILGFGLAGYRSFGPKLQRIGPCRKINLIVGQNNSGKSNILRFVHDCYPKILKLRTSTWELKDLEKYRTPKQCISTATVAVAITDDFINKAISKANERSYTGGNALQAFVNILKENKCGEGCWLDGAFITEGEAAQNQVERLLAEPRFQNLWHELSLGILGRASNDSIENIKELIGWIASAILKSPKCVTIPGLRSPGKAESQIDDFSGADIIHRIAQLQNPEHHQQERKEDFKRIERFLQQVTDRPSAQLEIPYQRDTITVHMDGRSLPLEALGTGIHEVIILAAAATALHDHVICIEEPEVHLHPLLQKKLLRYLDEQTDNQYFISTHSAHLLDHSGAAVFHVRLTDDGSIVTSATQPADRFAICTDLGYRASDLIQTNCIIWVEGPSDRIYLREWLRLYDSTLAEGIDYSIMFYGGRLLSHLSPDDPEVEDFISLRLLNRNMVVVIDSDREAPSKRINATKQRIVETWNNQPGFVWITKGREIENYIAPNAMVEALCAVAPKKKHKLPKMTYDKCIAVDKKGNAVADKVKVAHWLVDNGKLTLSVLDVDKQIRRLAAFVRESNHPALTT